MSLHRSWLFRGSWSVHDAEGSLVGNLHEDALLDPWRRRFAVRRPCPPAGWTLAEISGCAYARLEAEANGRERLAFTDARLTNPFLRMLVLGSFLLLHPTPPQP